MTAAPPTGRWQFWIDRGGTFTSVVGRRPDGHLRSRRLLTDNPGRYGDAALRGVRDLMGLTGTRTIAADAVADLLVTTTAALNTLLPGTTEAAEDRPLLVVSRGFGDVLRLDARDRARGAVDASAAAQALHGRVLEVDERVTAAGAVETAPDPETVGADLRAAFAAGFRTAAVAFVHGDRFGAHETLVADLAREIGFTQVSVSHAAAPSAGLAARAATTVADAYLSPGRRSRGGGLAESLGKAIRPRYPRSDGTVGDTGRPAPRDDVLAGPAAGTVAVAATSVRGGFDKAIGIDVGGTSTKIAHFNGTVERTGETVAGRARLAAPAVDVRTLAVGGGSVLAADRDALRVGPESAGSDPGSACFRRGGPLTVTDSLVFLGRIQPRFFPAIFGEDGDRILDAHAVHTGFVDLATAAAAATGERHKPRTVAEHFLTIAVETIAGAVRRTGAERGVDLADYVLNCHGGASGQMACLVAEAAGMNRVFLHPFAGALSAYGMAMEDIRVGRQRRIDTDLEAGVTGELAGHLDILEAEVLGEMNRHGLPRERVAIRRTARLRYQGTDTALAVDFTVRARMEAAFEAAHRERFGFVLRGRGCAVEAVAVEAVSAPEPLEEAELQSIPGVAALRPLDVIHLYTRGAVHQTPVYNRDALLPGDTLDGPAFIAEQGTGTVVDPGWRADLNRHGHLILTRTGAGVHHGTGAAGADAARTRVFADRFTAITGAMGKALATTASSPGLREGRDYACALFDSTGRLIAAGLPGAGHPGGLEESVRAVRRERGAALHPGDSYGHNAPHDGGTQVAEVTVVTPVFDDGGGGPRLFVATRARHTDLGGSVPGSMPPDSRTVDDEGVVMDAVALVDEGRMREAEILDLLASGPRPARNPQRNLGDLRAQIAANEQGARDLRRMIADFGPAEVESRAGLIHDEAAEAVRRALDGLADGACSVPVDGVAVIKARVTVDRERRRAGIDFTGTSPQHDGNLNAPRALCRAVVLAAVHKLAGGDMPPNAGCLEPIDIRIPAGCLLDPRPPAAVAAGSVVVAPRLAEALGGALGLEGGGGGATVSIAFGNDAHQHVETVGGGPDAGADGGPNLAVLNTRLVDVEILERHLPVVVEAHAAGGSGDNTGAGAGNGVHRRLRFIEPMTVAVLSCRGAGGYGRARLQRAGGTTVDLGGAAKVEAGPGDVLVVDIPAPGGRP